MEPRCSSARWRALDPADTDDCDPDDPPRTRATTSTWREGSTRACRPAHGGQRRQQREFEDVIRRRSALFFAAGSRWSGSDTDTERDLYQRCGRRDHVDHHGAGGGNGDFEAVYRGSSADGARVFFTTEEQLVTSDTDSAGDVYQRVKRRHDVAVNRAGRRQRRARMQRSAAASGDGSPRDHRDRRVARRLGHRQRDRRVRARERRDEPDLHGPVGRQRRARCAGEGMVGAAAPVSSTETPEQLIGSDTDSRLDVYERTGGTTSLLSDRPRRWQRAFRRPAAGRERRRFAGRDRDGRAGGGRRHRRPDRPLRARRGHHQPAVHGSQRRQRGVRRLLQLRLEDGGRVFFETAEQLGGGLGRVPGRLRARGGTTRACHPGPPAATARRRRCSPAPRRTALGCGSRRRRSSPSADTDAGTDIYEARSTSLRAAGGSDPVPPVAGGGVRAVHPRPTGYTVRPRSAGGSQSVVPSAAAASDQLTVGTGTPMARSQGGGSVRSSRWSGTRATPTRPTRSAPSTSRTCVRKGEPRRLRRRAPGEHPVTDHRQVQRGIAVDARHRPMSRHRSRRRADAAGHDGGDPTAWTRLGRCAVPGIVDRGAHTVWQIGPMEVSTGAPTGPPRGLPNTPFLRQGIFFPSTGRRPTVRGATH